MKIRFTSVLLYSATLSACAPPSDQSTTDTPPSAASEVQALTVEDLMTNAVAPNAELLWNAVSYVATADGVTETMPQTDADWNALRDSANALIVAGEQLMNTNRDVLTSDFDATTVNFQLTPDEIAEMLADDPAPWQNYAQLLQDTTRMTLQAIELRDVMGLQEFGAEINEACEGCHATYWYRPPGTMVPQL